MNLSNVFCESAARLDRRAGHKGIFFRYEKGSNVADLFRLTPAAHQRKSRKHLMDVVSAHTTYLAHHLASRAPGLGVDYPWTQVVDPHTL